MLRGLFLYLNLPFFLAAGLFYAAANHWAVERQPANAGAALGPLLLCLAAGALCSFPLRRFAERIGEIRGAAVAFFLGAALILALAAASRSELSVAGPLSFLIGINVGLTYARTNYLLHLYSPPAVVGRVMSLREILAGVAFAGSIGLTSLLGSRFSAGTGWLAAALVFAAGGVGMMRLARVTREMRS
jgi:hypothetical protein